MKTTNQKKIALATLGVMTATTVGGFGGIDFGTTGIAQASSKGRLNTTLALGALSAYGLLKGKKTLGIAGALGTAYAYSRYNSAKKEEKREDERRAEWYQQRYGRNRRNHYTR